jgi:hypothetical protein
LDDSLQEPRAFSNADFWFPAHQVVAELKCLEEDLGNKADFREHISALYDSWVRDGRIEPPMTTKVRLNLRDIPASCAYEFIEVVKKRLEFSTIKKTDKQIKQTKAHLACEDAKGWLLIANDGNLVMKLDMMVHLLARIIKNKYSSIHAVAYFSANQPVSTPGFAMAPFFWIDGILPGREPPPEVLRRTIERAWMRHHSTLIPGPVPEFHIDYEPDVFEQIDFIR